jgi:hypothetical protein
VGHAIDEGANDGKQETSANVTCSGAVRHLGLFADRGWRADCTRGCARTARAHALISRQGRVGRPRRCMTMTLQILDRDREPKERDMTEEMNVMGRGDLEGLHSQ